MFTNGDGIILSDSGMVKRKCLWGDEIELIAEEEEKNNIFNIDEP